MRPYNHHILFCLLIAVPFSIHSLFFDSNCITTTESPLKVHFQDEPLCAACMAIHGAGRLVLGHPLSPIRFLLNTACGLIPPCNIIWTVISFYFDTTPDRLNCRRLLGSWFDINKEKRSADNEHLYQSRELYNILVGKTPYYRSGQTDQNQVDETVLDAVRNVTKAFGVTDEHKTELFASMVLEGVRRVRSAYHYVTGQLGRSNRVAG